MPASAAANPKATAGAPCCSIVILTRNRGHFLPRTLHAILDHEGPPREILLFDNGSTDDTAAVARRFPIRYFSTPELGLAEMRQRGLEAAHGEFVIMCDDDCLPQLGWLENFVKRFREQPSLALIGGKIINVGFAGRVEKGLGRFGRNGQIVLGVPPEQASYFGCANLGIRRGAVLPGGGFDPFLVSGYEEGDLACSLLALGHRVGYAPDAAVEHHNVSATQRARWRWRHSSVMRVYFFLKHFRPHGFEWLTFLAWEGYLQLRAVLKGTGVSFSSRLWHAAALFLQLPSVMVRSGKARAHLLQSCAQPTVLPQAIGAPASGRLTSDEQLQGKNTQIEPPSFSHAQSRLESGAPASPATWGCVSRAAAAHGGVPALAEPTISAG